MVKTVVAIKTHTLPDQALVELVTYAIGLLAYRGRATIDDYRDLKALLDELPVEAPHSKAA